MSNDNKGEGLKPCNDLNCVYFPECRCHALEAERDSLKAELEQVRKAATRLYNLYVVCNDGRTLGYMEKALHRTSTDKGGNK